MQAVISVYNYEFGGMMFKESGWKITKTHSVHSAATARKSRASYCCTLCSLHSDYFKQQHGKHQWHVLASATALQFSSSFSIDPISYKTSSCKITVSVFLTLFWSIFRYIFTSVFRIFFPVIFEFQVVL